MKTSVKNIMMSFALMGCLIFSASDAMAQGRSRSQGGSTTSRSQSAAVSRSSNSGAPTVSRNTGSSMSRSHEATPQVNRSSSSSSRSTSTPQVSRSTSSSSHSASTPQVTRSTSSSSQSTTTPQVNRSNSSNGRSNGATTRVSSGTSTRGSSDNGTVTIPTTTRRSDSSVGKVDKVTKSDRTSTVGNRTTDTGAGNIKPNDNKGGKPGGNDKGGNGKPNGGNNGGHDKPNGNNGGKPGGGNNGGHDKPNGNHSGHDKPNGNHGNGGNHGYNNKNHYDYSNHHYRDQFSWNYKNHNWNRPLPPPARVHRPAPWAWYRPVIPAGWRPYASAPIIDRILGIVFGTYYYDSLNHLYCNGYYIDGYADDVIYLRDVPMLGLYWSDVMLNYSSNRLANAQFVFYSDRYDNTHYNIVLNKLSRIYGTPVCRDGVSVSWYGGDGIGFATLSMMEDYTGYYTTLSIGY